jgi:K+-transporting ATPase A subunit
MILGMSTQAFTLLHVAISLAAIATGLVVAYGLLRNSRLRGWTAWFLSTTVLTSITGFLFHSKSFGPPHFVGIVSLIVLAVALFALYGSGLSGRWRWIYVVTSMLALYFNVFVAVVQAFQKLPALHELAPTGQEPTVAVTQLIVLAVFLAIGVGGVRRFHPPPLA